jgi:hypothetical protein
VTSNRVTGAMGDAASGDSWITGNARLEFHPRSITNGVLWKYNTTLGIYRCPADRSTVVGMASTPRLRSYSMSTGVGHGTTPDPQFRSVDKIDQMVDPPPERASVFLDEDEFAIQNGGLPALEFAGEPPQLRGRGFLWRRAFGNISLEIPVDSRRACFVGGTFPAQPLQCRRINPKRSVGW